jgi:hypothetical protein
MKNASGIAMSQVDLTMIIIPLSGKRMTTGCGFFA